MVLGVPHSRRFEHRADSLDDPGGCAGDARMDPDVERRLMGRFVNNRLRVQIPESRVAAFGRHIEQADPVRRRIVVAQTAGGNSDSGLLQVVPVLGLRGEDHGNQRELGPAHRKAPRREVVHHRAVQTLEAVRPKVLLSRGMHDQVLTRSRNVVLPAKLAQQLAAHGGLRIAAEISGNLAEAGASDGAKRRYLPSRSSSVTSESSQCTGLPSTD